MEKTSMRVQPACSPDASPLTRRFLARFHARPARSGPDRVLSVANYRGLARRYDANCRSIEAVRRETVGRLHLRPGDVVLDAGSGTGLSFPLIAERIGASGRLIAIEHSPEMMHLARRRVAAFGWRNVHLIESCAEFAAIPEPFDAVLFHFTHDVLRSPAALANIFGTAKAHARVAAAGARHGPWWLAPVNLWTLWRMRAYVTTYDGLSRPWGLLESFVDDFRVHARRLGGCYVGSGTVAAPWPQCA